MTDTTDPASTGWQARRLVSSVGLVTIGSMVANLCAYLVHLPAGRWLGPQAYSEFAVLMAAMLVLAVPALAWQAVVAREVVRGRGAGELWALTVRVTGVVALLMIPATALFMWLAATSLATTVAGLSAAPVLVALSGGQGILQGARHFGALAVMVGLSGALRTIPVIVVLAVGGGPAQALGTAAIGAAVGAVIAWAVVRAIVVGGASRTRRVPPGALGTLDVMRASGVQFVLTMAVSLDLLVSRSVLDDNAAGIYALGAIATKAAFWLPQAIGMVFYPSLADPSTSRRSLRQAVGVVAVIGAVITIGSAVAGPLVPMVVGQDYRPLVPILWVFALTGGLLAILQVSLLSAIARDRTAVAWVPCVVLVVELGVIMAYADTVLTLAVIAVSAAAVSTLISVVTTLRSGPNDSDEVPAAGPTDAAAMSPGAARARRR